jgi:hypothetical protein
VKIIKIVFGVYDGCMKTLRIAAWSGPRNISTAMMRSWENRPDTMVCDEPFYAHYLQETGLTHPGFEEVIHHHQTDPNKIIDSLTAPSEFAVQYQKHMTHHLLPSISTDWIGEMTNIFLIRHPREMLTSLMKQISEPTIEETGLPQQLALFESLCGDRETPIVLESRDILQDPRGMLTKLCASLHIPFYDEMLLWPKGKRESDGVWAPHWYASVEASTGFSKWKPKEETVPAKLEALCLECEDIYVQLRAHKMTL